jgi:putative oxidoreductase
MDLGLLILRVVVGLALAAHGSQKLFGWFDGPGLAGTRGFVGSMRFRPTEIWVGAVVLGELGGGLLMALGFLNPIGPLGIIGAMTTATFAAHWPRGFWNGNGGYELPLTNIAAATAVAVAGPGRLSLDGVFGTSLSEPVGLVLAAVTLAVVAVGFAARARAEETSQQAQSAA